MAENIETRRTGAQNGKCEGAVNAMDGKHGPDLWTLLLAFSGSDFPAGTKTKFARLFAQSFSFDCNDFSMSYSRVQASERVLEEEIFCRYVLGPCRMAAT